MPNPPNISAYGPLLLTDGTVLVQDGDNDDWWRLYPDITGSYLNGTWKQLPPTPGYGPLYYASQVLPDGRVFIMGGEYNFGNGVWQNQGYIYDPVKNAWTAQAPPSGWGQIGDMGSVTLNNGQVFCADPFGSNGALFNPATNTFVGYGQGKADSNDEEGLTLLPSGNVLTVDCWNVGNAEILNTSTGIWSSAGSTTEDLINPAVEIGPQVLRPDGTVLIIGGTGHNNIYNSTTGVWSSAPDFASVSAGQLESTDGPACLLPDGNVLVTAAPGLYGGGVLFYEWNGSTFTSVPGSANAANEPTFVGNMLMLPTGQVLYTDQGPDIQLYTPSGSAQGAWAPAITSFAATEKLGAPYVISGTQFNGLSGCSAYGDDGQNETNYPQIKIINNATKHVFYAREYNPSTMAICTGNKIVSTNYTVPSGAELGPSTLQVVTNGIASAPVAITVSPSVGPSTVSVYQGVGPSGTVSSVTNIDGQYFGLTSVSAAAGQVAAIEVGYSLPGSQPTTLTVHATAETSLSGPTQMVYLYNWKTNLFDLLGSKPATTAWSSVAYTTTNPASDYISASGSIEAIVRAVLPPRLATTSYKLKVDAVQLSF